MAQHLKKTKYVLGFQEESTNHEEKQSLNATYGLKPSGSPLGRSRSQAELENGWKTSFPKPMSYSTAMLKQDYQQTLAWQEKHLQHIEQETKYSSSTVPSSSSPTRSPPKESTSTSTPEEIELLKAVLKREKLLQQLQQTLDRMPVTPTDGVLNMNDMNHLMGKLLEVRRASLLFVSHLSKRHATTTSTLNLQPSQVPQKFVWSNGTQDYGVKMLTDLDFLSEKAWIFQKTPKDLKGNPFMSMVPLIQKLSTTTTTNSTVIGVPFEIGVDQDPKQQVTQAEEYLLTWLKYQFSTEEEEQVIVVQEEEEQSCPSTSTTITTTAAGPSSPYLRCKKKAGGGGGGYTQRTSSQKKLAPLSTQGVGGGGGVNSSSSSSSSTPTLTKDWKQFLKNQQQKMMGSSTTSEVNRVEVEDGQQQKSVHLLTEEDAKEREEMNQIEEKDISLRWPPAAQQEQEDDTQEEEVVWYHVTKEDIELFPALVASSQAQKRYQKEVKKEQEVEEEDFFSTFSLVSSLVLILLSSKHHFPKDFEWEKTLSKMFFNGRHLIQRLHLTLKKASMYHELTTSGKLTSAQRQEVIDEWKFKWKIVLPFLKNPLFRPNLLQNKVQKILLHENQVIGCLVTWLFQMFLRFYQQRPSVHNNNKSSLQSVNSSPIITTTTTSVNSTHQSGTIGASLFPTSTTTSITTTASTLEQEELLQVLDDFTQETIQKPTPITMKSGSCINSTTVIRPKTPLGTLLQSSNGVVLLGEATSTTSTSQKKTKPITTKKEKMDKKEVVMGEDHELFLSPLSSSPFGENKKSKVNSSSSCPSPLRKQQPEDQLIASYGGGGGSPIVPQKSIKTQQRPMRLVRTSTWTFSQVTYFVSFFLEEIAVLHQRTPFNKLWIKFYEPMSSVESQMSFGSLEEIEKEFGLSVATAYSSGQFHESCDGILRQLDSITSSNTTKNPKAQQPHTKNNILPAEVPHQTTSNTTTSTFPSSPHHQQHAATKIQSIARQRQAKWRVAKLRQTKNVSSSSPTFSSPCTISSPPRPSSSSIRPGTSATNTSEQCEQQQEEEEQEYEEDF